MKWGKEAKKHRQTAYWLSNKMLRDLQYCSSATRRLYGLGQAGTRRLQSLQTNHPQIFCWTSEKQTLVSSERLDVCQLDTRTKLIVGTLKHRFCTWPLPYVRYDNLTKSLQPFFNLENWCYSLSFAWNPRWKHFSVIPLAMIEKLSDPRQHWNGKWRPSLARYSQRSSVPAPHCFESKNNEKPENTRLCNALNAEYAVHEGIWCIEWVRSVGLELEKG